jgi:hypothetical protein
MLQHAERVSRNVSQTCRFFGVSKALFYISKQRYEKDGRLVSATSSAGRTTILPSVLSLLAVFRTWVLPD